MCAKVHLISLWLLLLLDLAGLVEWTVYLRGGGVKDGEEVEKIHPLFSCRGKWKVLGH